METYGGYKRLNKILIVGGGGHSLNLLDLLEENNYFSIAGFIDTDEKKGTSFYGYPYIGTDQELKRLFDEGIHLAALGIGYMGTTKRRRDLFMKLKKIGFQLPALVDPTAIVSKRAKICEGAFIGKGAIVNAGAVIAENVIINSAAVVEHEAVIGAHSHVSVHASVCGSCMIGQDVFLGAGTVVKQGVHIGDRCLIGAASIVLQDIPSDKVAYGNPCREKD